MKIKFIKFSVSYVESECVYCGSGNVSQSEDGLFCWDCRSYQD